jgi:hypothetical protein
MRCVLQFVASATLPEVVRAGWKGPGADSEENHVPVSDIDIALSDSLKALDLKRPIRKADMAPHSMTSSARVRPSADGGKRRVDHPCTALQV